MFGDSVPGQPRRTRTVASVTITKEPAKPSTSWLETICSNTETTAALCCDRRRRITIHAWLPGRYARSSAKSRSNVISTRPSTRVGDDLVGSTTEVFVMHRQGIVTVFIEHRLGGHHQPAFRGAGSH